MVCDGSAGDAVYGGWEDLALNFIRDHGIVDEATLPYTATDYSPNWPLHPPYTLYRITADTYVTADPGAPATFTANVKNFLQTYGPVTAAIDAYTDFCWPTDPPVYAPTGAFGVADSFAAPETSIPQDITLDPLGHGDPNDLNHAIVITGYTDDPRVAGGGYWHIKNSWGTSDWGYYGYGFVSYAAMQADNYITGINGASYTVFVAPEPSTLVLLSIAAVTMIGCAGRRRWLR